MNSLFFLPLATHSCYMFMCFSTYFIHAIHGYVILQENVHFSQEKKTLLKQVPDNTSGYHLGRCTADQSQDVDGQQTTDVTET